MHIPKQILNSSRWKTPADFFSDYLKRVMTPEWGKAELAKPLADRHPVMQWYDAMCRLQALSKQLAGPDGVFGVAPSGAMRAYLLLAYDLYTLQNHGLLEARLLHRLRHKDQYQGARHELFAAATWVRTGDAREEHPHRLSAAFRTPGADRRNQQIRDAPKSFRGDVAEGRGMCVYLPVRLWVLVRLVLETDHRREHRPHDIATILEAKPTKGVSRLNCDPWPRRFSAKPHRVRTTVTARGHGRKTSTVPSIRRRPRPPAPASEERAVAQTQSDSATGADTQVMESPVVNLAIRVCGRTDAGRVRPSNEDHFLVADLSRTLRVQQTSLPEAASQHSHSRGHVMLVADGMGGRAGGAVASALTVESVEAFVVELLRRFSNLHTDDEHGVVTDLRDAVQQADARIFEEAELHPEFAGMGTTLTLAFVSGRRLFMVHAGDSRGYLFRGGHLQQLTEDHTVVAKLVSSGVISPRDASHHPYRHVLTNVLGGDQAGVRVDVQRVFLEPGDVLLLCTDGLSNMLDDGRIAAVLTAAGEPAAACERLVADANAAGGRDNITAVVARFVAA